MICCILLFVLEETLVNHRGRLWLFLKPRHDRQDVTQFHGSNLVFPVCDKRRRVKRLGVGIDD